MNPRQGPLGRIHHYRETSWGDDPTTPTEQLIPFMVDGFNLRQPRQEGIYYDGVLDSKGSYLDPIDVQGPITTSLDYGYVGYDLMDVFGSVGYSRVGSFHRWTAFGPPLPHGIRKEFTQSPAIIHRYSGVIARTMQFSVADRGQQQYIVDRLGKGDESLADVAGATLQNVNLKRVNSYFNGSLTVDDEVLGNTARFDFTIDRRVTPKPGVFTQGRLAAYSIGNPRVTGNLGKIFSTEDGDDFYLLAVNETPSTIIALYANGPLSVGATKFLRYIIPRALYDRQAPAAGGAEIPDQTQAFWADTPDSTVYFPGHAIGTLAGPFTFGASNVVSIKPEGGATINVTVTDGSAAHVAGILNADGAFLAKAKAYDIAGHLEIRSLDETSASSIQWQTGTANSAHLILGFTNTTWNGYPPSSCYAELLNDISTDYN